MGGLCTDDDLDGLYLTTPRSMDLGTDHAEVEMLLESYSKQVEEIVNEVDSLAVRSDLSLSGKT